MMRAESGTPRAFFTEKKFEALIGHLKVVNGTPFMSSANANRSFGFSGCGELRDARAAFKFNLQMLLPKLRELPLRGRAMHSLEVK